MLEVTKLWVRYGKVAALRGVELSVRRGEIVALIGANGAGKTTLLRAVSGLVPTASGQVVYDRVAITGCAPHRIAAGGLVQVPEGRMILRRLTTRENLLAGAHCRNDDVTADMDRILALFPTLRERLDQPAGLLSGGQQQMLAIGRALIARPRLLMLDEPSLGLAPIVVRDIFRIITRLRDAGNTILLVEQNARKALQIADRAYVLELGEVVLHGAGSDLMQEPRVIESYLGG